MQSWLSQAEHGAMRLPENALGDTSVKLKLKRGMLVRCNHNQVGFFLSSNIQDRADCISK